VTGRLHLGQAADSEPSHRLQLRLRGHAAALGQIQATVAALDAAAKTIERI
jgi:hypothetical protein